MSPSSCWSGDSSTVSFGPFFLFLVFFAVLAVLRIEVISGSEGSTIVMEGRASRTDFPFLFSLDIVSYQEKKELQKNVLLMLKETGEDIGTQASDCSDNTG